MKKNEVKIGGEYTCKVTNRLVTVEIDAESRYGGWDGVNLTTGKKVRIKSAAKLRGAAGSPAEACTEAPGDEVAPGAKKAGKVSKGSKKAPKRDRGEGGATGATRQGILGAAARVLKERDDADPLTCGQMVERMTTKGYWQPTRGGKTPDRTLYSAILREINTKGEASRFEKAERGKFTLTAKR